MSNIDKRIVEMQFDNKQFEKGVKNTVNSLNNLKKGLDLSESSKNLAKLQAQGNKFSLASIAKDVQSLSDRFSTFGIIGMTALQNITNSAIDLGKKLTSAVMTPLLEGGKRRALNIEQAKFQFEGLGMDIEATMADASYAVDGTAYSLDAAAKVASQLGASGLRAGEDMRKALRAVSGVAAMAGSSYEDIGNVFTKVAGQGRLMGDDLLRLSSRGINAAATIAKALNKTEAEVRDMVSKGKISFKMFADAMDSAFGEHATAANKTFTGSLSNVKAALARIGEKFYGPLHENLITPLNDLRLVINEINKALTPAYDAFVKFMKVASNKASKSISSFDIGWNQVLKEGINDAKTFQDVISQVAKEHGVAIEDMIDENTDFIQSLSKGWITADILGDSIATLTYTMELFSDAELEALGFSRKQVEALQALEKAANDGEVSLNELAASLSRPSASKNIIDGLLNILRGLRNILKPIGEAWQNIFPAITRERIYQLTVQFKELTEKLIVSEATAEKIKRTFKGLFSILDIIKTIISGALKAGFSVLRTILSAFNIDVLTVTASVGDAIVKFREWYKEHNFLYKAIEKLSFGLKIGIEYIRNWINEVKKIPAVRRFIDDFKLGFSKALSDFYTYLSEGGKRIVEFGKRVKSLDSLSLENFKLVLKDFKENVFDYFFNFGKIIENTKKSIGSFKEKATGSLNIVGNGFDVLKEKINSFITFVKSKFSNIGLGEILTVAMGASLIASFKMVDEFLKLISKPIGALSDMFDGVIGILQSVQGVLNAYATKIKSEALKNVAISIAILAGSVALLARMDQSKVWSSVGALGALGAALIGISAVMGKLKIGKVEKFSANIFALSGTILFLSLAMKSLEKLDKDKILTSLTVLGVLMAGLVASVTILSKFAPNLSTGSIMLLTFSLSLNTLVKTLNDIAKINPDAKSIGILVGLMGAMAGLMVATNLAGKNATKAGLSLLAISASILIMTTVLKRLNKMDVSGKAVGNLVIIMGSIAGLMAITKLAGVNAAQAGVSMLGIATSLLIMIKVIDKLDKLKVTPKAISNLMGITIMLSALMISTRLAGEHAVKAGTSMLLISVAIGILAGVMVLLSNLQPDGLYRALGAVTVLGLIFTALIAVTKLATTSKAALITLTVAIGILAVALGTLSMINPEGIRTATIALTSVIGMFALLVASTKLMKTATGSILLMLAVVAGLAAIIGTLAHFDIGSTLHVAEGLSLLLLSLSGSLAIASLIKGTSTTAIASLAIMGLVVAELAVILGLMAHFNVNPSIETAASLSVLLIAMSGALTMLSVVGATGPAAFIGIGALATLITALGAVMVGLGALIDYIPDMEVWLDKGMGILEKIGYALGSFFGNIVGGFLSGTTSGLPEIGANLSEFMLAAQPFFDGIQTINESAVTGVKSFAGALLALTAANILDGLTSWFTGGTSLVDFGKELADFAPYFKQYADTVAGIDGGVVQASANAASALAEMAAKIPNSGGVAGFFAGENDIDDFGERLVSFGESITSYGEVVKGIQTDGIEDSVIAGKALAELADIIPNSGGVAGFFAGENNVDDFGERLVSFGESITSYGEIVKGIQTDGIEDSVIAGKALAELADAIPDSGGVAGFFAGNNDMGDFGSQLVSFGESLKSYQNSVADIDSEKLSRATNSFRELVDIATVIQNVNFSGMADFGNAMTTLGNIGIDGFISAFDNAAGRIKEVGVQLVTNAEDGVNSKLSSFLTVGKNAAQGLVDGINLKMAIAAMTGRKLGEAALDAAKKALDIHSPSKRFEKIGDSIAEGMRQGITNSIPKPVAAATTMSNKTVAATQAVVKDTKKVLEDFKKWLDNEKFYGRISMDEELKAWEEQISKHRAGSEEMQEIDRNIFTLRKNLRKKEYDDAVKHIEDRKYYDESTTQYEIDNWEKILQTALDGSEEQEEAQKKLYTLRKNLINESYQHSLDWIKEEEEAGRLSLEQKLAAYERINSNLAGYIEYLREVGFTEIQIHNLITDKVRENDEAKLRTRKEMIDEAYQHSIDWIERETNLERMSLTDKLAAYTRIRNNLNDYADALRALGVTEMEIEEFLSDRRKKTELEILNTAKEINEAQKKYYDERKRIEEDRKNERIQLEKEYADKTKEINQKLQDDIKRLEDDYKNALDSRTKAIYKSYGLFDKVEAKKAVSGSTLMKNLQDQVDELDKWQSLLSQLSAKGLNSGLIEELQEMGPSAIAELEALNNMSSTKLAQYATLWSTKHKQAKTQATKELEGLRIETQSQIKSLRLESEQELGELFDVWDKKFEDFDKETKRQLDELRLNFEKQVGIVKANTETDFREMTSNVKEIMQQAGWNEMGQQIVDGLSSGVDSRKQSFIDTIIGLIQGGISALQNVADMHSPSRVFAKMGRYMDEGLVIGLKQYSNRVVDASADVGREAIDSMSNAISRIGSIVNGDMDVTPTIRPVIDMTDFRSGLNYMNTALTADRSMFLGVTAATNQNRINSYIDELASKLSDANTRSNNKVASAIEGLKSDFASLVDKITKLQVVMDTGTLVGAIGPEMDKELGGLSNMTRRGVR